MLRILFAVVAAGTVASATGCSTVGGMFGLSPPQYSLTPETVALRDAQSAGSAAIPKELSKSLLPEYVVEPGDTLLIYPIDLDSPVRLPGDQIVLPDGTIDLGRFGTPIVAGKTVNQIEAETHGLVLAGVRADEAEAAKTRGKTDTKPTDTELLRNARVNVRLVGRASKIFYVLGEVNAPGAFPLTGRETVLDGIIAAGNLTRKASHRNIVLARPTTVDGCRTVLPVCLDEIEQQADPTTNYQLQPGDRIFVPSKGTLEDFPPKRKPGCGPCGHPKQPCPLGSAGSACASPITVTAPAADPVTPPVATETVAPAEVPPRIWGPARAKDFPALELPPLP
ncbi:MAG: SLBB domain-containing protein, partial [Fimbriiglobus sp.]